MDNYTQTFYKVIVREPDGKERVVEARADQVIDPSVVLWDSRVEKAEPPSELLTKAQAEDVKRKEAVELKDTSREDALTRLLASKNADTEDLMLVLGLK
jgi:hypothetical protein